MRRGHAWKHRGHQRLTHQPTEHDMTWTKPEAEIVAVTMEVTAYVATL
ncbi:MAG: pyrroloquinoline quinone precursor peptide PqqA [Gemmatimonadales bacterium]|nr:pyrroloquinoline quinone precursor peptide PqqA [Gemmatimonadales bacterium]